MLVAALCLALAVASPAQRLVSAPWLQANRAAATIIAVAAPGAFAAGHIPGAVVAAPAGAAGYAPAGLIVLYQNGGRPIPAARAFVALDAGGRGNRVAILNGGLPAWRASGGAIAHGPSSIPARAIRPPKLINPNPAFADYDFMAAHAGRAGYLTLDARLPQLFSGAEAEPGEPAGHIPGAVNLPFTALATADGRFLPAPALAAAFRAAGYQPGDVILAYCHSGRKAAIVYVAARLLGYPVRLYPGSWLDWTAHHGPVVQ